VHIKEEGQRVINLLDVCGRPDATEQTFSLHRD